METAAQTVDRLLVAIEDLTAQEGGLFRAGDFAGAVELQQRIAPVVEALISLQGAAASGASARIAGVVAARRRNGDWLTEMLDRHREELRELQVNRRRLAQLRPAYRPAALRRAGGGQLLAQV